MKDLALPRSAIRLAQRLRELRLDRRKRKATQLGLAQSRKRLSGYDRRAVWEKTGGRCHICGESVGKRWQADHVFPRSTGGTHSAENYLPAHRLCNNYRWDYSPEELQWVLKIGIWARKQIETGSPLGVRISEVFYRYEIRRQKRRRVV
jgi:5-methylcytosine-specific restriction endonuclease McrA